MSDIYKVGVAIMLTDGLSPALSMLSHRLLGVHRSVGQINAGLGRLRTAMVGIAGVFAGYELIKGMGAIAMHGDKFLDQQTKLKVLGLSNQQIAEATAKAWANTRKAPGSMVDENVKAIGEMYSIVGFTESLKISTKMAQVDQVLKNLTGKEGQAYTIARSGELLGKFTDPKTRQLDSANFDKFLDLVVKTAAGSHGRVGTADWLAYAKQGNVSAGNLTEEGFLTAAMTMQAMGGHRAGTASQAMTRQFIGGVMARRVAEELIRTGVLDAAGTHFKKGGAVVIDDGAMKGAKELQMDQLKFMTDIMLPAWEKSGIDTVEKQQKEFYRAFGTGPAQRLAFELIRGEYQIKAERSRLQGGAGVDMAQDYLSNHSPMAARNNAMTAFDNMLTALGSETLKAAIPLMLGMTDFFNNISAFATAHPTAMKLIGEGFLALGAGLAVGGAGAILAAIGPAGWFVLGIVGLATAFATLSGYKDKMFNDLKPTSWGEWLKNTNILPQFRSWDDIKSDPLQLGSPPASTKDKQSSVGDVYLDGRKVGQIVARNMVASANGPNVSSAYFDSSMGHTPVDFNFARA